MGVPQELEEDVKENEKLYRLLFNNVSDAIILTQLAKDGQPEKFLEVNDEACQRYGYSREEMLSLDPKSLLCKCSEDSQEEIYSTLLTKGHHTFEAVEVSKQGELIIHEISSRYFTLNDREVVLSVARDISKRKKVEEELRETNEKLNAIIQSSPFCIMVLDDEGKVTGWNDAAEKIFGWSTKEVIGLPSPIVPKDKILEFHGLLTEIREGNSHKGLELKRRRKDGLIIDIVMYSSPLHDSRGNFSGVMVLINDITEKKQAELELLETRKRNEQILRMASMSAMAAGIAHEINQPLNSLKVICDSLVFWYRKGKNLSQEKVMEKLEKVSGQVDRISDIVRNMRSVIKSGQQTERSLCNINDCIESTLSLVDYQLNGVVVNKSLKSDLPPISAEPRLLEEVALNLILNAVQALEKSGKKEKELTLVTWYDAGPVMEVSDNALGIPVEHLDKIFEPFFTDKLGEGMGLGLFICSNIVSGIGGRISVRNNTSGGATFRVEFAAN